MTSLRVMTAGRRHFTIRILGPFALACDGQELDLEGWQPRPLRLLRLLAAFGGRCSRDEVIDHLWPDSSPQAGGTNLRSLVYRLGREMAEDAPPVVLSRGWVTLNPLHDWEIDLVRFETLTRDMGDSIPGLEEAVTLYRGEPLLEDRYEDWAAPIRDRLDRATRAAIRRLADLHGRNGSYREAVYWLQRLLELDPLDEDTLRELLRMMRADGRRGEAVRAYHRFEERLRAELDLQPEEETRDLLHALTAGTEQSLAGVRPLPITPMNLPSEPSVFIGRERDIAAVKAMIGDDAVRLLTLTGPGGIGKTRLAVRVAEGLGDTFPDGIYFVSLAALADPQLVISALAATLDLKETARDSLADRLAARLQDKRVLLLLDNCEHVLDGVGFIVELLRRCPRLTVVATSRAVLRLSGEREYPVAPLALPHEATTNDAELLASIDAVALFLDRARAVRPDLHLSHPTMRAIAAICRRLDGLPLAIELAAARVRIFPPQALLERLDRRLPLLTGGPRDAPARQQTLRDAIDWSYRLLTDAERALFARLSVFAGGWTLDMAQAVCALDGDDGPGVLDTMTSLAEQSLIRQTESGESAGIVPRFQMLETIREYAAEQLQATGQVEIVARRHALVYAQLAEQGDPELIGPDQLVWFDRLAAEHANMREALAWARAHGETHLSLRLGCNLFWFWYGRGYWSEARETLQSVLGLAQTATGNDLYAEALCKSGGFAWLLGDFPAARTQLEESIALGREARNERVVALALVFLGSMALWQGDGERSARLEEEALAIARAERYEIAAALALFNLGVGALQTREFEAARARLEEALAVWRQMGDGWGIAMGLNSLGDLARAEGNFDGAAVYYEECLSLSRDFGIKDLRGSLLHNLGHVAHRQGNDHRAVSLFREALSLFHELGDRRGEAECLVGVATSVMDDAPERAARLFGAAATELDEIGAQLHPANQGDYERSVATTRTLCGVDVFGSAWEEGRRMTMKERLACALSD